MGRTRRARRRLHRGGGIPVVGLDSLRYFWKARTPASAAADIDRALRYYLAHWKKQRALLVGYSQGANVLPFIVNRLPQATRCQAGVWIASGMRRRPNWP